jgi:hypothetical protein
MQSYNDPVYFEAKVLQIVKDTVLRTIKTGQQENAMLMRILQLRSTYLIEGSMRNGARAPSQRRVSL